jgi:hypothetical protein
MCVGQEDIKGGKGGREGERREKSCSALVSPVSTDIDIYFSLDIYVYTYIEYI